ncbi:MAG: amidohydrolase family protein [Actinomyces sp.]|nr:amidohydrolase family protein [Actinomyces sp.]
MYFDGHLFTDSGWVRGQWNLTPVISPVDEIPPYSQVLSGWAAPAFTDVHCHIGVGAATTYLGRAQQREQLDAMLRVGVTLLRDCGSPVDTSWVSDEPRYPTLIRCGRHIARPMRYIRGLARELSDVRELPYAAREECARGDGWVKIVGDWIDRSGGVEADLEPLWPREILIEAVAGVHEAGGRVAVHAFSSRVIDDLIEAGVDDIEHASGMDQDQIREAKKRGIAVSVTMLQRELFKEFSEQAARKYPRYSVTMNRLWQRRYEQAQELFDSGITVLPASDTGGYQQPGSIFAELRAWGELGLRSREILQRATLETRRYLGVDEGLIGGSADLVGYSACPDDIDALLAPLWLCRGGELVAPSSASSPER